MEMNERKLAWCLLTAVKPQAPVLLIDEAPGMYGKVFGLRLVPTPGGIIVPPISSPVLSHIWARSGQGPQVVLGPRWQGDHHPPPGGG